ncbi:MAG: hypothetical protein LBS55_06890 [Prevotellaceae bacterium]|jgi:hypothetical protein|nr:hypothetical protein [Prevotellaceae bacterium]
MKTFFVKNLKSLCRATALLIGLISFGFAIQSCNNDTDDEIITMEKFSTFLDIELESIQNNTQLSTVDIEVMREAQKRIDPYVVYEKNQYKMTIKSGYEVNISERLFSFMTDVIYQSNDAIKQIQSNEGMDVMIVQDKLDPKLLHIIDAQQSFKEVIRLKREGGESKFPVPNGENGIDFHWYGFDIYITNEVVRFICFGGNASSAVVGFLKKLGGVYTAAIMGIASAYLNWVNEGKGIIIHCYGYPPAFSYISSR